MLLYCSMEDEILCFFKKKILNSWKDQLDHYASLTDDSQTDFVYLAPDYTELEFLS